MHTATQPTTMTAPARKRAKIPMTIQRFAQRCLKHAKGDTAKATETMTQEVISKSTTQPFKDFIADLVREGCTSEIGSAHRANRAGRWTAPNYAPGGHGARVRVLAQSNMLMYFELPGGKPLSDATGAEVLDAATFYRKQAKNMQHKALWLEAIAAKVGAQRVSAVLNEKQLRKMQKDAEQ